MKCFLIFSVLLFGIASVYSKNENAINDPKIEVDSLWTFGRFSQPDVLPVKLVNIEEPVNLTLYRSYFGGIKRKILVKSCQTYCMFNQAEFEKLKRPVSSGKYYLIGRNRNGKRIAKSKKFHILLARPKKIRKSKDVLKKVEISSSNKLILTFTRPLKKSERVRFRVIEFESRRKRNVTYSFLIDHENMSKDNLAVSIRGDSLTSLDSHGKNLFFKIDIHKSYMPFSKQVLFRASFP